MSRYHGTRATCPRPAHPRATASVGSGNPAWRIGGVYCSGSARWHGRFLALALSLLVLSFAGSARAGDIDAASRGDSEAMLRQAWKLEQDKSQLPAALALYRRAAESGSIEAQYHLAQSYLNGGLGVVDAEQAQYWYGRVREHGVCPSVIRTPHTL